MTVLNKPGPHESAHLHVTGRAKYVADDMGPPGTLFALPVPSPIACGTIEGIDTSTAEKMAGIHAIITAQDVPGENIWGPILHNEPLLADGEVHCKGQPIAVVIADSEERARHAAASIQITITEMKPIIGIEAAIEAGSYHTDPHIIERGDLDAAFQDAYLTFEGEVFTPGQDHFYLETQAAFCTPEEDGTFRVASSTQHPTEIQKVVAATLGLHANRVICEVPRVGGGFGGKESQASPFAAFAALGAFMTGRPCRCWLHRHQDMSWTGKRHPFLSKYKAAFDADGQILAMDAKLWSDGGWSLDLSGPVMDRALFHVDSSYFVPALRVEGRVCATNVPSNTAFRGFGGPQGMAVIEDAMDTAAEILGVDATHIRCKNLYGDAPRNQTPYGQIIEENRLPLLVPQLMKKAEYERRVAECSEFNSQSLHLKRGLAFQPVKFGISFTASLLNQAGALVHVYTDGSVQVNHGGTEMGQGLHTKIRAVAAEALGVELKTVRLMTTATDKVPNTSATAASSGSDLNGAAVLAACQEIRSRLAVIAAGLLETEDETSIKFSKGAVTAPSGQSVSFSAVAQGAWAQQVSLSSTGYYATPGIAYDPKIGRGRPFFYYAFGGAISEVEVNGLTGEYRLRRVDIVHDVGTPLAPSIDIGQIEGAFVQGMGWLTCEDVIYDETGRLLTPGPSTYKIPAVGDVPISFNVHLLEDVPNRRVVGGSKAVGEPPFMLGISVVGALRNAITSFGQPGQPVQLKLPATPEAVLRAVVGQRKSAHHKRTREAG